MGRGQGKEGTKCLDSETGWGVRCMQKRGLMPFPYERGEWGGRDSGDLPGTREEAAEAASGPEP